jgi:hypothetical protein
MPPVWNFIYNNPHKSYSTELFTALAVTIGNVAYIHWEEGKPIYRVWFQYGLTSGYGKEIEAKCLIGSSSDGSDDWESPKFPIRKGTTYHARVKVESGGYIGYSDDFTFTTPEAVEALNRADTISPTLDQFKGKILIGAVGYEAYWVYFEYGNRIEALDKETEPVYAGPVEAGYEFWADKPKGSRYYRAMAILAEVQD